MKHNYMLKVKSSIVTVLLIFTAFAVGAQTPTYFSSGTGSNNSFPFNSTTSNKVQWIFVPNSFPGSPSGLITKVYFKSGSAVANRTYTNLTIKMGYTSQVNTTATFITGLTTVFFAPSHFVASTTTNGWVGFTLTTPFFYDNTQNLVVEASQTAFTPAPGFTVVQSSAGGNKRTWGSVTASTGSAGSGLVNFGFDLLVHQNNASIAAIPAPTNDICVGTYPVTTQIKNTGANIINNVEVNWSVNGVMQPMFVYNTPIPIGGTSPVVTIGNLTFTNGVTPQNIKIWTSNPNGQQDPMPSDDSASITRKALEHPQAIVLYNQMRACPGDSILISAPTGTNLTYQWQMNADPIPGATSSSYYVKKDAYYSVKVFNPGCNTQSVFHKFDIKPLKVDLGADTTLCETSPPLVLDADESGAGIQYLWSTGKVSKTVNVGKEAGKYWVTVSLGANCTASDTINLDIHALPRIQGITFVKQGDTYHFSPGGAQNVDNYLWHFGDGGTDTAMNPIHTFSTPGPHNVTLQVFNSCGVEIADLKLALDVNDVKEGVPDISLYPNPAQDNITIKTSSAALKDIKIYNSIGALVYRQSSDLQQKTTVDVSQLPNGNYSILIFTTEGSANKMFQVIK